MQKDGATMSADQRAKAEKDLRDGNRELSAEGPTNTRTTSTRARTRSSRKLQNALVDEVQSYARAQKFDLVLADGVYLRRPVRSISRRRCWRPLPGARAVALRPAALSGARRRSRPRRPKTK